MFKDTSVHCTCAGHCRGKRWQHSLVLCHQRTTLIAKTSELCWIHLQKKKRKRKHDSEGGGFVVKTVSTRLLRLCTSLLLLTSTCTTTLRRNASLSSSSTSECRSNAQAKVLTHSEGSENPILYIYCVVDIGSSR